MRRSVLLPWFGRRAADLLALAMMLLTALLGALLSQAPRSTRFTMETPTVVLPRTGFSDIEYLPDGRTSFRWTTGLGRLQLANPGDRPLAELLLIGGPQAPTPARLTVGSVAFNLSVMPEPRRYTLLLPPSQSERMTLTIESPTTRVRRRDLGVAVGDVHVAGNGAIPARALLALLFATAGGYLLLRQAGWRIGPAVAAISLLQAACALWLVWGGWRYALLGPLLTLLAVASVAAVMIERGWPPRGLERQDVRPTTAGRFAQPFARRDILILAGLLVAALSVRLPWLAAPDPVGDLEISARRMGLLFANGLAGAYSYEGDYLPLRLYILRGLSALTVLLGGTFYDPVTPITRVLLKLPGLLADMATVALIYGWARRRWKAGHAGLLTTLYTLAPPVWINVAWWGQVDALLMLPLLGMVALLDRAGGRWSWLCYATAMLIKAQAIILTPLLFVATLRRHGSRRLLNGATLAAALILAAGLPLLLAGQGEHLLQAYLGSVERFPRTSFGAYNLWYLLLQGKSIRDTTPLIGALTYRMAGMLLIGAAALLVGLALLRRCDRSMRAQAAATLMLAFFVLPTQIHERYLFLVLAFLCLSSAYEPRLLIVYLVLVVTATLNILGELNGFWPAAQVLISSSSLPMMLAMANVALLVGLLGHLLLTAHRPLPEARTVAPTRSPVI